MASKFKKGDRVRCVTYRFGLIANGQELTISEVDENDRTLHFKEVVGSFWYSFHYFELVTPASPEKPKTFVMTGKKHQCLSMVEDLKELGFTCNSDRCRDNTICFNITDSNVFDTLDTYKGLFAGDTCEAGDHNPTPFDLNTQYSAALEFAKEQMEIAKVYFKSKDEIRVGDWVIATIGDSTEFIGKYKCTDGNLTFPVTLTDYQMVGGIWFTSYPIGAFRKIVRKATPEEIAKATEFKIGGHLVTVRNEIGVVQVGCQTFNRADIEAVRRTIKLTTLNQITLRDTKVTLEDLDRIQQLMDNKL